MKKVVAKTYSVERIADVYLAALAKSAIKEEIELLPDILREQNIYFDEDIIAGVIQLLQDQKYIAETGDAGRYTVVKSSRDDMEVIIYSAIINPLINSTSPKNVDFSSILK
jgi:hypothetical protein